MRVYLEFFSMMLWNIALEVGIISICCNTWTSSQIFPVAPVPESPFPFGVNFQGPPPFFQGPPLLFQPFPIPRNKQTYFIAASKKVRDGQTYKIFVALLADATTPLDLTAWVRWNTSTVAHGTHRFLPGSHDLLLMKVKKLLPAGSYELVVEGHFGNGGTASSFRHRAALDLESSSVNIIMRLEKPIYRQDDMVRCRIIPLTPSLTPHHGTVDVFIYNPDGYLQRRYPALHSNFGVVNVEYQLAPELKFGTWKMRAQTGTTSQEIEFPVEEFNQPLIEVNVTQPVSIFDTEEVFRVSVQTNLTWGQPISGNCTVEVFLIPEGDEKEAPEWDGLESVTREVEFFEGVQDFEFPMEELRSKTSDINMAGFTIGVKATVFDYWYNETRFGYSQTRVYNDSLRLTFLGDLPQVFVPGTVFTTHLGVSKQDGALPSLPINVEIRTQMTFDSASTGETRSQVMLLPKDGVLFLDIFVPFGVAELAFEAISVGSRRIVIFEPYEVTNASKTRMTVLRRQIHANYVLQVSSTTRDPRVGQYIIFNIRASYFLDNIYWIVTSKGAVVLSGNEEVRSTAYTFSIAITAEMAPKASLVVFNILSSGEVIADRFLFPVDGISRNKFSMTVNHRKDFYKRSFEVIVKGDPLAFVGFSAVDRALYPLTPGLNSWTRYDIMRTLHQSDKQKYGQSVPKMTFLSSEGFAEESSIHLGTNSYGIDTWSIFEQADLVVFTDGKVGRFTQMFCDERQGELPCVSGGCYNENEKCDGVWNCKDGTDEGQCGVGERMYEELLEFRKTRFNHIDRTYVFHCCWTSGNISPEGHFIVKLPMPERPAHYVFSAVSMSETLGLGLLDYHVTFDSIKPFHMIVETAERIHQGEQVSLRCALFNYYEQEIEVLIILHGSEQYDFIEVGPLGVTTSYFAKRVPGTIHHSVWMAADSTTVVYVPVVPRVLGEMNVKVTALTQLGENTQTKTIEVIPEGVKQYFHTSIPLDLTITGMLNKYLDIASTQHPDSVPFQLERLFVANSPKASISAVGDVFGPILAGTIDSYTMLRMPHQGGEMSVFSFAMNLYALDFLRRTNQLKDADTERLFNALNAFYQTILNYQEYYGPFHQFMNETLGLQNSVWLTTLTIQVFEESRRLLQYADWEEYFYVDPLITEQCVKWILKHQLPNGAFLERAYAPYDRKMAYHTCQPKPTGEEGCTWMDNTNATLTAQVVISLHEIISFSGSMGSLTTPAKMAGTRYLERVLDQLFDPYEIAIVTYALTIVNSPAKDAAFEKLDGLKNTLDRYIYWGKEGRDASSQPPEFELRNNIPLTRAHIPKKYENTNIAATSYALMVYNLRRSFLAEKIAAWLNTQRLHNTGFSSTQDTYIATKALMHHSYYANVREATDINITIYHQQQNEMGKAVSVEHRLHVKQSNLSTLQEIELAQPWGQFRAIAQGSGYAILQLDVEYSVDHVRYILPPPVAAFDVWMDIIYTGWNASILILKPCARWTLLDESPQSGMAVIEVDIPSGYYVHQPDLEAYCGTRPNHLLRYAEFYDGKVSFFLDYLDGGVTCVEVLASRWYPVANLTRFITLKAYDYYAPERFNTTLYEANPLYYLTVCQVCGSFQCPYCPNYNAALQLRAELLFIFIFIYSLWMTFSTQTQSIS